MQLHKRFFALLLLALLIPIVGRSHAQTAAQACISIMGDSLPANAFVVNLPATGVTVLQGETVGHRLDDALQAVDALHYGIYDLSLGASSLAAPNYEPYLTSREAVYGAGLNCRFVLIFPFLNDLYASDDRDDGVAAYAAALTTLLDGLAAGSPDSEVVLLDYYHVTLNELGLANLTYGEDVSLMQVSAMNAVHASVCAARSAVWCYPTAGLLFPIDDYVVTEITRSRYDAAGYVTLNPDDLSLIERYWQNAPNNSIYGDGLHLNPAGQDVLVAGLIQFLGEIFPEAWRSFLDG